jgi:hypothetical protein
MTTFELLQFVIASGRMKDLLAHGTPNKVAVICDLTGADGIGAAVAQALNPDDFRRRSPECNLWSFLCPMETWQHFRKAAAAAGNTDTFTPGMRHAVVVADRETLVVDMAPVGHMLDPRPRR